MRCAYPMLVSVELSNKELWTLISYALCSSANFLCLPKVTDINIGQHLTVRMVPFFCLMLSSQCNSEKSQCVGLKIQNPDIIEWVGCEYFTLVSYWMPVSLSINPI